MLQMDADMADAQNDDGAHEQVHAAVYAKKEERRNREGGPHRKIRGGP
ncbi:hypothetical protein SDC9_61741 [bioreactor metagenome]|uniref:Uncharacterized protein n=1 Tax=bioreactor metagenome TaxID=1076179 RepID=A0A644XGL7_9ZZZZ